MKKAIVSLLSIFMLLESMSLYAWGPMGHDVVAAIAEQHLDRKSIVYYSSWMDNLRNSPYWESSYSSTKTWHYANSIINIVAY